VASKTLESRVAEHDRQIAAIKKLMMAGMRMLSQTDAQISLLTGKVDAITVEVRALAGDLRKLAAAQTATEKKLASLIDTLRGPNGHGKLRSA
jgi:uncharacterized coiled-coil protein SlyX